MRRFEHRYWDGVRWTEHVSSAGSQSVDPVEATVPEGGTPTSSSGHQVASGTRVDDGGANSAPAAVVAGVSIPLSEAAAHAATMKVTTFNAKRVATEP
jgi:hypothetical protein